MTVHGAGTIGNHDRVAIVLVNFNGWRECVECIDSLLPQRHPNFHVFVVDNCSTDRSVECIAAWCADPQPDPAWRTHAGVRRHTAERAGSPVRCRLVDSPHRDAPPAPAGCLLTVVRADTNLGFAAGCNVGVRAAGLRSFDYFWFLNPDTVVTDDALVELLNRARRSPEIGMVGSTLRYYDRPDILQAMGGGVLDRSNGTSFLIGQGTALEDLPPDAADIERQMAYVMGASMLVTSRFIEDIGPMEEDYFLYYEEIDWAWRSKDRFTLGFAPQSHVFHKSGVNSAKAMPMFSAGFFYRNRLRFVARFMPDRLGAAKRSLLEQILRHLARRRWDHARIALVTLLAAGKIIKDVAPRTR